MSTQKKTENMKSTVTETTAAADEDTSTKTDALSTASTTTSNKNNKPRPDPGFRWGKTPSKLHDPNAIPGPDHPVHKIPPEEQEKMRRKGVNPVLWAEMNQHRTGEKGFWSKVAGTALGGGVIR